MASEQFSLCWDNFHKNMSSGMNSLLENEDLVDVTLAVEGKCLKAHKMVLSVCSPYFKELFKSNPCQHPIVFMKDVSYVAISDLLQFMYQGEVQVSQENLTTFIKTAEALQIKGLTGDGNGSLDNDESGHEKSARVQEDTYKPVPKTKRQPPAPVVTTTPTPKRQRLSASSNDSQPPPTSVVAKTEPVTPGNTDSAPVQFKVEPYDQNQTLTIPDDDGDNFGDDTLDDNTADDTEDYSMMEGEEPQAGTSADGAGEGQGVIYYNAGYKHPKIVFEGVDFRIDFKAVDKTSWRCSFYYRTKCRAKLTTKGHIVTLYGEHNHEHRKDLFPLENTKPQLVTVVREKKAKYNVIYFDVGNKLPKIVVDFHDFNMARKTETKTHWICSAYFRTRCKSRAVTCGRKVYVKGSHNHVPKQKKNKFTNMLSQSVTIDRNYD